MMKIKEKEKNKNLIVITGPTGSGKTSLSIKLAEYFSCPIISADSRQVYKGMPIGTAQPEKEQLDAIKHYFISSHEINDDFTAGKYEKEALEALKKIYGESDIAIAVGGSGLYIDALCEGMDALPAADKELRGVLAERLENYGIGDLLEELKRLDPEYYKVVDRSNHKRIIRALEVCISSGMPYSRQRTGKTSEREFKIIKIGTLVPREILYQRINDRVNRMIEDGLEEEARSLYNYKDLNSLKTVGYREFFGYFDGSYTKERAIELIKQNSRRYAKRQMTWFRRDQNIKWFDPDNVMEIIEYIEGEI